MGVFRHLVPGHAETAAVGAEHRVGGIFRIPQRIVFKGRRHFLLTGAGRITAQLTAETTFAVSIGNHFGKVIAHGRNRRRTS